MVWDNNSNQIVVLNAEDTESCQVYWLPIGECMECESFTVVLREENFDINYVVRDFLLQSIDEDYEFNCRMISACYWPDSCAPIRTAFDLINKVKTFRFQSLSSTIQLPPPPPSSTSSLNHHSLNPNSGSASASSNNFSPLIVHDLYGGFRAATFCALYTFQDLVQMESSVNVYELAKMFHLKRPNVWASRANISFLYEAVDSLFEEIHLNNHNHHHNQFQFKNYLNFNIDNHLSNYYSNNFGNLIAPNNNNKSTSMATTTVNTNHTSLTLLPIIQNSSNQQTVTVTLPNLNNTNNTNCSKSNNNNNNNQRQVSADVIGSRLHNFQNMVQHQRASQQRQSGNFSDPSTALPLQENGNITGKNHRTSFLPAFFSIYTNNITTPHHQQQKYEQKQENRNSSSKTMKFMNTVRIKGASFKRVLFSNYTSNFKNSHVTQTATETFTPTLDALEAAPVVVVQANSNETPQPAVVVTLASASSSSTHSSSSSSSSALSLPQHSHNNTSLPNKNASDSLSKEKIAL
jgi:hypothetical protein